jgi:beta-lactam-binding protein with PASTA domain
VKRLDDGRSADVDKGEVMAVTPAPGQQAGYKSTVSIQISAGVPLVQVPDVVGMNEAEATAALKAVGLQVESTRFFGDRVFRQSVSPGETVEQGTKITILLTFG